jgi:hypothetical protein
MPYNMEKSRYTKGLWIGHGNGPWRVTRANPKDYWTAVRVDATKGAKVLTARTLSEISKKITAIAKAEGFPV